MKESDRCEGQYCQLRWSVMLLHGMTLSLFHGDQFSFDVLAILALGNVHAVRHTHCACYWQLTCHLWRTQCTCLWKHTWLWQCTRRPLCACTPSLVYSLYSTLAYLCCWSSHCAVRSPSHLVNNNMNFWLLRGSLFDLPSHSFVVVIAPHDMTIRNDCRIVNVVIKASQSISLLASRAFTIIDAVNPHWS